MLGGQPAGVRLAIAGARAADQIVLVRIVAIIALDAGADPLELVPHAQIKDLALVALVFELPFELADIVLEGVGRGNVSRQGGSIQGAERQRGADLVPGIENLLPCSRILVGNFFAILFFLLLSVM